MEQGSEVGANSVIGRSFFEAHANGVASSRHVTFVVAVSVTHPGAARVGAMLVSVGTIGCLEAL